MSDKTTTALAAEQADTEATTTQEAELLPATTLDELEQVDLGTVAEGERAPFRITDDRCADWAIRKIADERSEYDRLKALADEQIAAINEISTHAPLAGRDPYGIDYQSGRKISTHAPLAGRDLSSSTLKPFCFRKSRTYCFFSSPRPCPT